MLEIKPNQNALSIRCEDCNKMLCAKGSSNQSIKIKCTRCHRISTVSMCGPAGCPKSSIKIFIFTIDLLGNIINTNGHSAKPPSYTLAQLLKGSLTGIKDNEYDRIWLAINSGSTITTQINDWDIKSIDAKLQLNISPLFDDLGVIQNFLAIAIPA